MSPRFLKPLALAAALAGMAASAQAGDWFMSLGGEASRPAAHGAGVYAPGEALRSGEVFQGAVLATRLVKIENGKSNLVETGTGALAGGALGSQIGKGRGRDLAILAGALLGGAAGNAAGDRLGQEQGQEVIVRLSDGKLISVVQAPGDRVLSKHDEVYVVRSVTGNWRVWND